jgi:hypothetical protein
MDPAEGARGRSRPVGVVDARPALPPTIVAGRVSEIDDIPKEALVGAERVVGVEILLVKMAVGNGAVHACVA